MEITQSQPTKYRLLTLGRDKKSLSEAYYAGVALRYEGEDYYILKISMLNRQTFYLSRDKNSQDRYSIFSRKVDRDGAIRLQNRVGLAKLHQESKAYLEIEFDLLERKIFLDLYPSHTN